MSSIQHLFIESLSGGVLEAGDTKTTKIQASHPKNSPKVPQLFFSPKFSVSSEFHILLMATYCPQILKHLNHLWHIFPHSWPSTQFRAFTSKNSPGLRSPLLPCCCWLGLHFAIFLLNCYGKSLLIVFSALKSSPLFHTHPGPFVSRVASWKQRSYRITFLFSNLFLKLPRLLQGPPTSRWYKEEKSRRWRMMGTSIKNWPNYSASVLWEPTFMFCQNFYLFFSHQKLEILIFIEVSCF